jgi:NAD(P)-dependent dehydrogenase (short-subunit alcohol dehydrogenase family)
MMNPMNMTGRTVLVTGGSSGIGRETSVLLSKLGARIVLVARNEMRLEQTMAKLQGTGHYIEVFDLARVDEIPSWLKQVAARNGPLDGLVHSAGIQITRPLRFISDDDVNSTLQLNVGAAVSLAKGFRQKQVRAETGSIVFLTSVMGLAGVAGLAAYAASKGALIALARALAIELVPEGIRVNCVAPGYVRTEMTEALDQILMPEQIAAIAAKHPMGVGKPLDVAYAVAFLLADTGSWITGTTLVVDGGYTAQ